ncbi:MAG TPA: ATP-binding protein [Coleofasciculaceae cyanobacterium]|jgi:signal transduction histidine kinase
MAKPGQSSFRRILLSRLLLLSVPVLLAGVYVTYRTARKTLLETARQNLIESAVRKGERIQDSIAALQASLVTASETVVLQSESKEAYQRFIEQLAKQLPAQSQCVQLIDLDTKKLAVSTCGNQSISSIPEGLWPQQQQQLLPDRSKVYVRAILPQTAPTAVTETANVKPPNQLTLVLSVPIYDSAGQLQYALSIQAALLQQEQVKRGSLSGYPVVINQAGTILTHPLPERVGRSIEQEAEVEALKQILTKAIAGQQHHQHLFSFEKQGVELLAGYTAIDSPITAEANQKWVLLAITPINSALAGLQDIQKVLLLLTCGLIAASFLATVYLSRDLARPLEKLTDYALNQSHLQSTQEIPHNFNIREFNQLSEALEGMISRLKDWAEELETAWKEAQTANQLKNEFLANTSHELRTPLNGIIGCLRLVRDGFCDNREEELDFLQRADDAAIHLLGIINDVLDIAKIEAGKLSVEIEPIDLQKLLNEVINLQAVPIQQKGIEFHTPDLSEVIAVRADPAKLKQVLLNVVGNAVKFTDSGSITISTRIEEIGVIEPVAKGAEESNLGSQSSRVVVTVKDTGIGIDPTQQHKLFRPFVMVDGSTTRKCGGTGLGLAISRNLIEMMGGSISLFSDGDDKGTTVEIALPTIEPSLLLSGESPTSIKSSEIKEFRSSEIQKEEEKSPELTKDF